MDDGVIDLEQARRYIAALAGDERTPVTWQTFDDSEAKRGDLAATRTFPLPAITSWLLDANRAGAGIFVTVNETDGRGRTKANIVELRALFVDVDGTADLPTTWPIDPSIVVQRGPQHWHAYWLLTPGEDLDRFAAAQAWLACYYRSDPSVVDLPRVMRVPGFAHRKGDPVPVQLLLADGGRRYDIDTVLSVHIVRWEELGDRHERLARRHGIWPDSANSPTAKEPRQEHAPRRRREPSAEVDDETWQREQFLKWAAAKDTLPGDQNPNGGRDRAAYIIAREGYARGFDRPFIEQVVMVYLQRSGFPEPERACDRIVTSALSKAPGQAHLPQRRSGPPRPPRGGDDDGGAGDPPWRGAADEPDDEPGPEPRSSKAGNPWGLDLEQLDTRWAIGPDGVCPIEWNAQKECYQIRVNKRVSGLPIWPEQEGQDVVSGGTWWRLAWQTPRRQRRNTWMPEAEIKRGLPLVDLAEGPIAKRRAEDAAVWLTEARSAVLADPCEVISRTGWCGINGSRRWVWPGAGEHVAVEYIGNELYQHGDLEGWTAGLRHLAGLEGDRGFTALSALGLSAAAPWSRLQGGRNAVLGLMAASSSGKGSCLEYALSVWTSPDALRIPAGSTVKGIQDLATGVPDLPIWLDELQQLTERQAELGAEALYFLANGQRRVTSSKTQQAVGGERRHGVGFYAAEAPILPGLNVGVQYRVIELLGAPCPDEATAKALQAAAQHAGCLAGPLSEYVQSRSIDEWVSELKARADDFRGVEEAFRADDPEAIALIQIGLEALERLCEVTLPIDALLGWLCDRLAAQRAAIQDRETVAIQAVLDHVLNLNWTSHRRSDDEDDGPRPTAEVDDVGIWQRASVQQVPIAWRKVSRNAATDVETVTALDVNGSHRDIATLLREHGGDQRLLRAWRDRGWIETQGDRLKCKRKDGGGRVIRISSSALSMYLDASDTQEESEIAPPF